MATIYRDYGASSEREFPNNSISVTPHGQVFMATHEGETLLPFMKRSFISFTFGGKRIEEYNLIATTVSNSLNRDGSAPFNDTTTTYDNLDGQQYWSTHYTSNTLSFTLATDGIDQQLLDNFLYWFRAGETKELILAEHPNRATLARVSEAPHLDLLPFEHPIELQISEYTYNTSTTLYKGTIDLSFVMDSPHWYSLTNILGRKSGDRYINQWQNAEGNWVDIFASQDALKILFEDGIPLGSIIQKNMLLGNGAYASVEGRINQRIWDENYSGDPIPNIGNLPGGGACTSGTVNGVTYSGYIAGAVIDATGNGITSLYRHLDTDGESTNVGYFYYSGNAPAATIITFTMTPEVNADGYITAPFNSRVVDEDNNNAQYTSLFIESKTKQELRFTTPNLYTSYNEVIYLFNTYVNQASDKQTWEEIRELLRENVRHARVREWANKVIDDLPANSAVSESSCNIIRDNMQNLLKHNGSFQPATFSFNSETGEAVATFKYHYTSSPSTLSTVKENVGDMLRSNYIIIRDRNYPRDRFAIDGWTEEHPEWSHRIYHTSNVPLSNLSIVYKNMYL